MAQRSAAEVRLERKLRVQNNISRNIRATPPRRLRTSSHAGTARAEVPVGFVRLPPPRTPQRTAHTSKQANASTQLVPQQPPTPSSSSRPSVEPRTSAVMSPPLQPASQDKGGSLAQKAEDSAKFKKVSCLLSAAKKSATAKALELSLKRQQSEINQDPIESTVKRKKLEASASTSDFDWSQWEEVPGQPLMTLTCYPKEASLGLELERDEQGSIFVESKQPGTWAAIMNVETPCKLVRVNDQEARKMPKEVFSFMMQQRPVRLAFRKLRPISQQRSVSSKCAQLAEGSSQLAETPSKAIVVAQSSHCRSTPSSSSAKAQDERAAFSPLPLQDASIDRKTPQPKSGSRDDSSSLKHRQHSFVRGTPVKSESSTSRIPAAVPLGNDERSSDISRLVKLIKANRPKIIVLLGAGASTSAGIPDFRSPGSGLYDNLKEHGLPCPTAAFNIRFFRANPVPFYRIAKKLWPTDDRKPTLVHDFLRILHDEKLLLRCYTQNIDGLERAAGLPEDKVVEAHGNFRHAYGIDTGKEVPIGEVKDAIFKGGDVAGRIRSKHGELVKPGVIFFGETLSDHYLESFEADSNECEMLIVIGTSLKVNPVRDLVSTVRSECLRVLINRAPVGRGPAKWKQSESFCPQPGDADDRDILIQGACDDVIADMCAQLDWKKKLQIYNSDF